MKEEVFYNVYECYTDENGVRHSDDQGIWTDRAEMERYVYEMTKKAAVEKNGKTYRIKSSAANFSGVA